MFWDRLIISNNGYYSVYSKETRNNKSRGQMSNITKDWG